MTFDHLGGSVPKGDANTYLPDIYGYLLLKYGIRSVLDIGCARCHNLKWWLDQNVEVLGVDGDGDALNEAVIPLELTVRHDFEFWGPWEPTKGYDLCLCTEFVEHVDKQCEAHWFAAMKRCKYVLMCHALPGQGGHHHVNEQPTTYWYKRFSDEGFQEIPYETDLFRETALRKPGGWGRQTLLFFSNMFLGSTK